MTKLTALRVTVPTDDEVTTEDLQLALRGLLEAQPLSRIAEDGVGGRIHWAGTEAAEKWTGYMDGAIRAGDAAAAVVHARLA